MIFGRKRETIQITEDFVVQELMKLPKGLLIGMMLEMAPKVCKQQRIDEGLFWHLLLEEATVSGFGAKK